MADGNDAAAGTAVTRQRRATEAVWTVQMKRELDIEDGQPEEGEDQKFKTIVCWEDIATVTVPPATKRRRVYELALEEIGYVPQIGVEPPTLRALDEESAREMTPELNVQLRIG